MAENLASTLFDDRDKSRVSAIWIQRHFPRLSPFLGAARSSGRGEGSLLPEIQLSTYSATLLEMAFDGTPDAPAPALHQQRLFGSVRRPERGEGEFEPCSGVKGEARIPGDSNKLPPWLRSGLGEGYGLVGIAYTLAGLAYARSTTLAIAEELGLRSGAPKPVRIFDTQKELAEAACESGRGRADSPLDEMLAYVKLDGDSVGALFQSRPSLLDPRSALRWRQ